ncbi:GNAT family N-acetyltransferase [Cryobacterium sp. CG_9.6]|uniref:GNAT family N-acetyltransferase n=1 Tax=Cryobacterium sp. CG_9.6 TaxID=2760710 RepID=UPI0024743D62|nr:GNAT family N-acetyltransferase [Cryobacterium sp. CG_9.6]MDH6237108.1 GNAT superfamily N-acetyltransferase [Cryobacterium sp. CG_9.6]
MIDLEVRLANPSELAQVALLRWESILEKDGIPTTTLPEFIESFTRWAGENGASHRCTVALRDGAVIGMAWLAIVQRVPSPRLLIRASGDLQGVYVRAENREFGVGSALISSVLELARGMNLERVTVHSSPRAIRAYVRNGFTASAELLQTDVCYPRFSN